MDTVPAAALIVGTPAALATPMAAGLSVTAVGLLAALSPLAVAGIAASVVGVVAPPAPPYITAELPLDTSVVSTPAAGAGATSAVVFAPFAPLPVVASAVGAMGFTLASAMARLLLAAVGTSVKLAYSTTAIKLTVQLPPTVRVSVPASKPILPALPVKAVLALQVVLAGAPAAATLALAAVSAVLMPTTLAAP